MPDRKEILTELFSISPKLAEIPNRPVFAVPTGYFDDFPSKMIEMIKKEENSAVRSELEEISPFLASLEKKNPMTVPDGYFNGLEKQLIPEHQPGAKVVKMGQAGRLRIMYAAAVVVAVLGIFTWFFVMNNENSNKFQPETAAVNINSELPKVSADEITNYLESVPEDLNLEPISLAGVEEADLDAIMNEIHESELQQFINENPGLQETNMN